MFVLHQKAKEDSIQVCIAYGQITLRGEQSPPLVRRGLVRIIDIEHGQASSSSFSFVISRVRTIGLVHIGQVSAHVFHTPVAIRLYVETNLYTTLGCLV